MRNEDPPNKEVHASDLASALDTLQQQQTGTGVRNVDPDTPVSMTSPTEKSRSAAPASAQRSRSSTIIYQPEDHGSDANLPQVLVEDTSLSPAAVDEDVEMSPVDMPVKKMPPKTSRPPVELME